MDALCERDPGPMDHMKIERKCTIMYSTTGVKVTHGLLMILIMNVVKGKDHIYSTLYTYWHIKKL